MKIIVKPSRNRKMNRISNIGWCIMVIGLLTILLSQKTLQAQRLELRFNKDFSNHAVVNKSLGGGGSIILDGWAENFDFQINVDYAGYKLKADYTGAATKFTKINGGISALYVVPVGKSFIFRVGGDVSYNNIQQTDSWNANVVNPDNGKSIVNCTHRAHFLGIGAVLQLQAKLGKFVRLGAGLVPTYLIPLANKTDHPEIQSKYKTDLFVMQLQIGLEFKLYND